MLNDGCWFNDGLPWWKLKKKTHILNQITPHFSQSDKPIRSCCDSSYRMSANISVPFPNEYHHSKICRRPMQRIRIEIYHSFYSQMSQETIMLQILGMKYKSLIGRSMLKVIKVTSLKEWTTGHQDMGKAGKQGYSYKLSCIQCRLEPFCFPGP